MPHATMERSEKEIASPSYLNEGERLERQLWEDIKNSNLPALEKKISPEFQAIHSDGTKNRNGELLQLVKGLNLGFYTLSNFKTTQQDDTLVVTYNMFDESSEDESVSQKYTPRMSVWKKNASNQWHWIAHANPLSPRE